MVSDAELTITREELYERIWRSPVETVAKEIRISGVALATICRRLSVPRPPRGYWTRVRHGLEPERPPLPPLPPGTPNFGSIHARPAASTPAAAAAKATPPEVSVPDELLSPHPLVKAARAALRRARPDRGQLRAIDAGSVLDIRVGAELRDRALRILDAFIRALMARGHSVVVDAGEPPDTTSCTWILANEERLHFTMRELFLQQERERTKFEILMDDLQGGEPRKVHELVLSGRLAIEICTEFYGRKRAWADRGGARLEDLLGRAVLGVEAMTAQIKQTREDAAPRAEIRAAEQRRLAEIQRRATYRCSLERELDEEATQWARAQQTRAFLQAARERLSEAQRADAEVRAWFEWADAYARGIDPLENVASVPKRLVPSPEWKA